MDSQRIRVAVLFGGRSAEHEVSLTSARAVLEALASRPERYEIIPVAITKAGRWLRGGDELLERLRRTAAYTALAGGDAAEAPLFVRPDGGGLVALTSAGVESVAIDVVFPVLHGPFGEDGAIQGLLKLADLPYVGCGVLGSAIGMDKVATKTMLRGVGLPVVDDLHFTTSEWQAESEALTHRIGSTLGFPCFVKPANMGSSVGVSKVKERAQLAAAVAEAASHDRKILVERAVVGCREVECAVLGNDGPRVSVLGEIVPCHEFYDYQAKYLEEGSRLLIPAPLSERMTAAIQQAALHAFSTLDCAGMARVDFFVAPDGSCFWINELNTIPGFTPISMYPKLWEASGLPFDQLVDELIRLALELSSPYPAR